MHKLKLWLDRQLVVESWNGRGLSPINTIILSLILLSAALYAVETEETFSDLYLPQLRMVSFLILVAFALEFFLRLWSAGENKGLTRLRDRIAYAGPFWLTLDFIAFAPELILFMLLAVGVESSTTVEALKALRLLRLLKLAHLMPGGRMVVEVFELVAPQLLVALMGAIGMIYLSAVLIYFFERHSDPEHFGSVLRSLWWSVVTLTTIGYGDVYPITVPGKVMASIIAVLGVGVIALPSGIIAGAFMEKLRERQEVLNARKHHRRPDEHD